jgi:hypothetical protein
MVTVHYTLVVVMEAPVVAVVSLVIHEQTQELELLAKATTVVQAQDLEQILVLVVVVLEHKVGTVTMRMDQLDLEKAELDYRGLMVLGMLVVVVLQAIIAKGVTVASAAVEVEVLVQAVQTAHKDTHQEQSTLAAVAVPLTRQDLQRKVALALLSYATRFKEILWHIMQK